LLQRIPEAMARGRVTLQGRRGLAALLALFGLLAMAGPAAGARAAEFEIVPGSFTAKLLDAEGNPETRAGSHPDRFEIGFALHSEGTTARDFVFELPPGFSGSPDAVPACPRELFEAGKEDCPEQSQVGNFRFTFPEGGEVEVPAFQLEPAPGELFAIASKGALRGQLKTELRASDFGVTMRASDLAEQALTEAQMELWGVPADHQVGTTIPRRPMLTTPTGCGPLSFTFRTRSWLEGAPWLSATTDASAPLEGCAALAFEPTLALQLSNPVADSPTGLRMELLAPEAGGADELANALVKDATVELPEGLTVSPSGAAGLTACSDAQLDLESSGEAHCPPTSRVGTVEIASGVLKDPLNGTVYLGEERPSERIRFFVVAPGPGVVVKFAGALHADPATGRFSATLADIPQLSFRRISLSFDGGSGALLASPLGCGPAVASGKFVPYGGGATVESRSSVTIAAKIPGTRCPGPAPFAPRLLMHSSRTGIGRATSLSVRLLRQDGEAAARRFTLMLPAGLGAAFGSVQACADADVAAGTCPLASRIGGLLADVGSGSNPATLRGDTYLTGPDKRGPFGLLLQLHATIGPLDLGTVSFRASATVSGRDGRVIVSTDKLPEQIEGVPIRFQAIELSMDRPGLIHNPTSCRPAPIDATIESSSGTVTTVVSPLPLSGCHRLGFRPRFHIALEGRRAARRHNNPGLLIAAHLRPGDTGLRAMQMTLPRGLGFDLGGLKAICSRPDAALGACPADAQVGTAAVRTSLLSKPLKGGVYIVQPEGNGLPELGVSLAAMGVHAEISGRTENRDGRFVTKLVGLPDMLFSTFTMRLDTGSDGVFSLGSDPCKRGRPLQLASTLLAIGQDGSRRKLRVPIETNARCR
jgi:hypothetical protein